MLKIEVVGKNRNDVSAVLPIEVGDEGIEFTEFTHYEFYRCVFFSVECLDGNELILVVGLFAAFHFNSQLADELGTVDGQLTIRLLRLLTICHF
jgi:hypothetical protein